MNKFPRAQKTLLGREILSLAFRLPVRLTSPSSNGKGPSSSFTEFWYAREAEFAADPRRMVDFARWMEKTLQVLNALEQDGVVGRYAIGGAMGATFYVEPVLTFDLAIFVIPPQTAYGLLTLEPLYGALRARGYTEEGECVNIEGVPVQFLPAYNELLVAALAEARETLHEQTPTRVLRAEHLAAIAVQTGRDKDRQRVRLLREQGSLDDNYLAGILARYSLEATWKEWTT